MPFLLSFLFTPTSLLWLLFSLLWGAGYAWLLYSEKSGLSRKQLRVLSIFRVLSVAGITFLLSAPLFKITTTTLEKPLLIIAQDNSASIQNVKAKGFDSASYSKNLKTLERELKPDYEVKSFSFSSEVKPGLNFGTAGNRTDISAVFRLINEQYAGRNIGAVILASDGIYNSGSNPQQEAAKLKSPIYTIALGDTIPKRDLLISGLRHNDIVYLNNDFQAEVEISAYQSSGNVSKLTISNASGVLYSKAIKINSNNFHTAIPITLSAKKKGTQRYNVILSPVSDELSEKNNFRNFFIEVIDGRQQVLIVSNSPHPDIGALKQSIETSKNYEVKTLTASKVKVSDIAENDLIILHQLPSASQPAKDILQAAAKKPLWFILGAQSSLPLFSASQETLNVTAGALQETFAAVNPGFYSFTLSEGAQKKIQTFAPLLSPAENFAVKNPAVILLSQKDSDKPLLLFSTDEKKKTAVLTGEGLWRWQLEDFQENQNHKAFNELISKTVQYLTAKEDKRKFRVYPEKNSFEENENIHFSAELYNNAYELVNTPDVKLNIKNEGGKAYSYLFSKTENAYELDAGLLPPGEYTFTANTSLGKENYKAEGRFEISEQQAELMNTTADHQLLYSLSKESGGKMIFPDEVEELPKLIKENELIKTVSHEDRRYEELIDLKLLFFLLLTLLTVEWFVRKRSGLV